VGGGGFWGVGGGVFGFHRNKQRGWPFLRGAGRERGGVFPRHSQRGKFLNKMVKRGKSP